MHIASALSVRQAAMEILISDSRLHRSGSNGYQQCQVCFEGIWPPALAVHLPCGHCTCNECWQVSALHTHRICAVCQASLSRNSGAISKLSSSGVDGSQQCLVCFEDIQPSALAVHLPCGHCTCNDCWQVSACLHTAFTLCVRQVLQNFR